MFIISWLQIVLSVLVRYFSFELPDGPSTQIEIQFSRGIKPKMAGEEGFDLPLVVRRVGL